MWPSISAAYLGTVRSLGRTSSPCPTLGLAPGGVCRADRVTSVAGALLPHRFTLTCAGCPAIGGLFSVALSCGSPRHTSREHPALRSPDLPRPERTRRRGHPADSPPRVILAPRPPSSLSAGGVGTLGEVDERPDAAEPSGNAVTISQLYDEVTSVLESAFPRGRALWVTGEIQKISESSGHAYIDMIDTEAAGTRGAPVLKVKCWRSTWGPLKADLARTGATLAAGMTVAVRGRLDFYKARAEVGFILDEVDVTALLGRLALERARLLDSLRAEGLLDANARRALPAVARRIGLVGSPGTEGFSDFLGQLERSGITFEVLVARATVQGPDAPKEVARAIALVGSQDVDLICVVRGGGSRADLAAFDSEPIARAIATASIPVFTGIGHTGDESVADLVAHTRCITPTACGQEVAGAAMEWLDDVRQRARYVADESGRALRQARRELAQTRARMVVGPSAALQRARTSMEVRRERLVPGARAALARGEAEVIARRRLLRAFDPARQLARGWTMTLDSDGAIVRSADGLVPGAKIVTRFVDGEVESTVSELTREERDG